MAEQALISIWDVETPRISLALIAEASRCAYIFKEYIVERILNTRQAMAREWQIDARL